jgi:hypothetical protein
MQSAHNIHIGAGRIFLNVTAPTTGDPPTLTAHADGQPTTGTEVGYTEGASTFTYKATKQEVNAEQSLNPVDVFITTEMCQLEFTAMEHVYNTLKTAFDSVGSVSDSAKDLFYGGDSSGLVSVTTQCVVLTSRIRTSPTKFEVLTLYRVYNVEGIVVAYNRVGVATYKVTLKGLVDNNRVAGDRLFQWFRERLATGESPSASTSPSVSPSKSPSASVSPS